MDVEKLIDRMKLDAADWNGDRYIKRDLLEAAESLEKLQAENESLKNKLHDSYQGHLLDVVIPRLEAELEKAKMARPIELTGKGAEAFALAAELSETKQELENVKAERDAAVADVCAIIWDVEEIRRGYGVDNADADDAFAGLCESYCANYGHGCYKEGSNGYYCANFKWRGPQKEE